MRINKKTATAITGIDWALAELIQKPQQPDEFSAQEFFQASKKNDDTLTLEIIRNKLARMVRQGQLVTRKAALAGRQANLYRRP